MAEKKTKEKKETVEKVSKLSTNAVFRTLSILESLSYHTGVLLDELAVSVNLSCSTLFRFLDVLQRLGYVEKDKDNRYRLTAKLFMVATRSIDDVELSSIARPLIEDFSFETGETVILSVLDNNTQLHIQKVESRYTRRFYERIGKRSPLYCTASGKVLLSGMNEVELNQYLGSERFIPYTINTVPGPVELRAQIEAIRVNGFSEGISEYEQDIHALACPIYNHDGQIVAALSINWPTFREESGKRDLCLTKLKDVARHISIIMGYTG